MKLIIGRKHKFVTYPEFIAVIAKIEMYLGGKYVYSESIASFMSSFEYFDNLSELADLIDEVES